MRIAFSPCPNDTFIFHAWVHGLVPSAPQLDVTYADIDITNHLAVRADGPDVLKISYAALPWVLSDYALLPCGGALGRGCGPLVLTSGRQSAGHGSAGLSGGSANLSRDSTDLSGGVTSPPGDPADLPGGATSLPNDSTDLSHDAAGLSNGPASLSGRRVAVPSERSTAYLLFRLWAAQQVPGGVGEIVVMPFDQIMPAVRDGEVDAGLVIHEARFTYRSYGLALMADLGSWWEGDTGLPIPLGAIIARRSLDLDAIAGWIRSSLAYAWAHPAASADYILDHAQEMAPDVVQAHIGLYVNEYSADLGESGYGAVEALLGRAADEGLVPRVDPAAWR